MFILNEKTTDKTVFQYTSRDPFKGPIEQEGSYLKVWILQKIRIKINHFNDNIILN